MKTIQPVKVWFNGQEVEVTLLSVMATSDNLKDAASFQYQLMKIGGNPGMGMGAYGLVSGGLSMTGDVYQNWQTNEYAYDWVAQQLNLTITGDYVPPVTEQQTVLPEPEVISPSL